MTPQDADLLARDGARLFSRFVCRIGALPTSAVEALRSERLAAALGQLAAAEAAWEATQEKASDVLYRAIGATDDPERRALLLRLRRDLFNARAPRQGDIDEVSGRWELSEGIIVAAAIDALRARDESLTTVRGSFASEVAESRKRFRVLIQSENFQCGLLASSRALFEAQARYLASDALNVRSKELHTENGLLRYFTRTAMKATPFGTFCQVVSGQTKRVTPGDANGGLAVSGDAREPLRLVRLNKKLYVPIVEQLLRRPRMRARMAVSLNPTTMVDSGQYTYLAVAQGREAFQRLPETGAVAGIVSALQASPKIALQDLLDVILGMDGLDATPEEVAAFVDKLLEIGFLRFDIGIRNHDPDWDRPLLDLLTAVDDPIAQELATLLDALRTAVATYARSGLEVRTAVLKEAQRQIAETFSRLSVVGPVLQAKALPFMEDVASPLRASLPAAGDKRDAPGRLVALIQLTRKMAHPRQAQSTMRRFFDAHYGNEVGSVPLLRFYEEFHRNHLKAHLERLDEAKRGGWKGFSGYDVDNPLGTALNNRIREAKRALAELISSKWMASRGGDIDIRQDELESALSGLDEPTGSTSSASVWITCVNPTKNDPTLRFVLEKPGYAPGHGKQFSRFLELLPQDFCEDVKRDCASFKPHRLAEIAGDGNHNANLHPPLLPFEIAYPTAEAGPSDNPMSCTAIDVIRDPIDPDALILVHRDSGERIIPVDLGFLYKGDRPPLFQLLHKFTPLNDLAFTLPERPGILPPRLARVRAQGTAGPTNDDRRAPETLELTRGPEDVIRRPRITFEGCVVVARRRWTALPGTIPGQLKGESASDYFVRIDRWRRRHLLPDEVYVRILSSMGSSHLVNKDGAPSPEEDEGEEEDAVPVNAGRRAVPTVPTLKRAPRSQHNMEKPQYVDFHSPLMLPLIARLAEHARGFTTVIEERLPTKAQALSVAGESFAAEQVLQVNIGSRE